MGPRSPPIDTRKMDDLPLKWWKPTLRGAYHERRAVHPWRALTDLDAMPSIESSPALFRAAPKSERTRSVVAVKHPVDRPAFFAVFVAWALAGFIDHPAQAGEPAPPRPRMPITIGFYVSAIRDVDWGQRRFYADLYWWIRYPATVDTPGQEVIEAIEFVNADPTTLAQKELERKTVATGDGSETYVNYRTVAFFHFEPDFHRYPFDVHTLPIVVEHETLAAENLMFVDDLDSYADSVREKGLWGLGGDVSLPDFAFTEATRRVSVHRYDTTFGDPTLQAVNDDSSFECSRMTLGIGIQRVFTPYLVKIMIPLIICLLLPYLVFFIDAENLEVASGLTVTSLLACVAIQLTVVPGLPDVGYVVTSDLLFYLAYLLAMLAMAQTVWSHNLARTKPGLAHRLDLAGRYAYPLIFLTGFAWIVWR